VKKWLWILAIILVLSGCGKPESFETVSDEVLEPTLPAAADTVFWLPGEAAQAVFQEEAQRELYLCGDFTAAVQTLPGGDLDATLRSVTGFSRERLQLIARKDPVGERYVCAWASAGEAGDLVGRTLILDDGNYHYTLTLTADADKSGDLALTWQDIFASFTLSQGEEPITKG